MGCAGRKDGRPGPVWAVLCCLLLLNTGCRRTIENVNQGAQERDQPVRPQRVLTSYMLFADTVELGVIPIAASKAYEPMGLLTPAQWNSIEEIPLGAQSGEHLLNLKLDMTEPQLPLDLYEIPKWKERFFAVAEMLKREAEARQLMQRYLDHAARVRQKMAGRNLRVSILEPEPDSIDLLTSDSFAWTVLREAGVTCCAASRVFGSTWLHSLSWESVQEADSDVLFIIPSWNDKMREGQDGDPREILMRQPLWSTLKVVKNHRVFSEHDYWRNGGALAADRILTDFERDALHER